VIGEVSADLVDVGLVEADGRDLARDQRLDGDVALEEDGLVVR